MARTLTKTDLAEIIRLARVKHGLSWAKIADAIGKDKVWTVAALLGQHPLSTSEASIVAELLELDDEAVAVLQLTPYRGSGEAVASDPTMAARSLLSTAVRSRACHSDCMESTGGNSSTGWFLISRRKRC